MEQTDLKSGDLSYSKSSQGGSDTKKTYSQQLYGNPQIDYDEHVGFC